MPELKIWPKSRSSDALEETSGSRPQVVTGDSGSKQGTHVKEIAGIQGAILMGCGNRGVPVASSCRGRSG